MSSVISIITDALVDTVKLVPFLFLTYLLMEWVEHKTTEKTKAAIRKAGKWGPFAGGALGLIPQCGFSAAAASLYAGKVITRGTLIAVFLSTSDEMLPIMISSAASPALIGKILGTKLVIGILVGLLADLILPGRQIKIRIHELCDGDNCHCDCDPHLLPSAIRHTLSTTGFILLISLVLNAVIMVIGEAKLGGLILNWPFVGELISGVIGLIPNCAASIVLTSLYLEGGMSYGALITGLLTGAGVGMLVLFRENRRHMKDNLLILAVLYVTSVAAGCIVGLF